MNSEWHIYIEEQKAHPCSEVV